MTDDPSDEDATAVAPDAAFGSLGNETRVAILRALGDAGEALPFSELRAAVGVSNSGQFNYHLEKLVGHFVRRTDEGYELRRAGERVVEAVLSGAVTETPVVEPTRVDRSCEYCGGAVGVTYREERLTLFCTECAGVYGERVGDDEYGHLGSLFLPPAGVEGRSTAELLEAAHAWGGLATVTAAAGVCPRCSATLDERVSVCETHERSDGVCEDCGGRYAVAVHFQCTNCIYERSGAFGARLLATTELLAFMTRHGINPITASDGSSWRTALGDYDEEVLSIDPFRARFTFAIDDDVLSLTVDDDLSVADATESRTPETG